MKKKTKQRSTKQRLKPLDYWRFAIFKYDNGELGIHEAYFDRRVKKPHSWTEQALLVGDSLEDLLKQLDMVKRDITDQATFYSYDDT